MRGSSCAQAQQSHKRPAGISWSEDLGGDQYEGAPAAAAPAQQPQCAAADPSAAQAAQAALPLDPLGQAALDPSLGQPAPGEGAEDDSMDVSSRPGSHHAAMMDLG